MSAFEEAFGLPYPEAMIPETEVVSLTEGVSPENSLLVGSPSARDNACLLQGEIKEFLDDSPEGYFLAGFWGHGVNSYAFYYSLADYWRKIFFRLPYGGVYMDNKKNADMIREFLISYLEFERAIKDRAEILVAVDSMSAGYYEIVLPDGESIELKESLFHDPSFKEKFDLG